MSLWNFNYFKHWGDKIQETQSKFKEQEAQIRAFCQTTKRLPRGALRGTFSCDWEGWQHSIRHIKAPLYYDLSSADMLMKCVYGLTPPIRPICYVKDAYDHEYIFESDGKYYSWLPEPEDLLLLNNAQSDETALKAWFLPFECTRIEEVEDGYEKLDKLKGKQRALAAENRKKHGNTLAT